MNKTTQQNKAFITVKTITKCYTSGKHETLEVLRGLDFEAQQGDFTVITGESGSGKSTFLHILGGIDRPTQGSVTIDSHNITKFTEDELSVFRRRYIGFVFQFHHLLPDFTALENLMLPMLNISFNKAKAKQRAMQLLHDVHMDHRSQHKPKELSGGEQQRIAIARALINTPLVVLADEPTGNLDERNSLAIKELFLKLHEQYFLTFIVVTHNQNMKTHNIYNNFQLSQGILQKISTKEL